MPASDVLTTVKLRLGITGTDRDNIIMSYVDEIEQRIRHYCHFSDGEEVPVALEKTWASMTMDVLRIEQGHLPEVEAASPAPDIRIGDTEVIENDDPSTTKKSIDEVVLNYKNDLNRYRKLRW